MKRRPSFPFTRSDRGSALLLTLCIVMFLSIMVLGVAQMVNSNQAETAARSKEFRARQLAESGLAIALHPLVRPGDHLLTQTLGSGERFEVKISSEQSRLQINMILANDQRSILTNLFGKWGLSSDEASAVVDCLEDWISPGDLEHLNGAKQDYYASQGHPEYPTNRPFQSVEEMALVRGMDVVAKHNPRWKDFFTIWGDGRLDVNEAPAELLEAMCGLLPEQAEAVIQQRQGPDGAPGVTRHPFTDLGQFQAVSGMSESAFKNIAGRLVFQNAIQRIESSGFVGDYRFKIVLVARKGVNPVQYFAWLEP